MNRTRSLSRPAHYRPVLQILVCLAVLAGLFQPAAPAAAAPAGPTDIWMDEYCGDDPTDLPNFECEFLSELWDLNGSNWINKDGWLEKTTDPCTWYGITCTEVIEGKRHIQTLNLANNNLGGMLVVDENTDIRAFQHLDYATTIRLGNNNFNGSKIPPGLTDLSVHLEVLELQDCGLTGEIPAGFGNLSGLKTLNLEANDLSGSIPPELGNLINLVELNLGANETLTGPIPASLGNLSLLQRLVLDSNDLNGSIPSELGNLTNLQEMRLNGNSLSGALPTELAGLTSLITLHLEFNNLSGALTPLSSMTALEEFVLSANNFEDSGGPLDLSGLTHLMVAYLNSNRIGYFPSFGAGLPNLQFLNLTGNKLTGQIPPDLRTKLSGLDALFLNYNSLDTADPVLSSWLTDMDDNGNWRKTKTIPPDGIVGVYQGVAGSGSVNVYWAPTDYTYGEENAEAFFEFQYSTNENGPWLDVDAAGDPVRLDANTAALTMVPAAEHWIRIRAYTGPFNSSLYNVDQKNALTSEWSAPEKVSVNPFPELLYVSPLTLWRDQSSNLILTGRKFVPGITVYWTDPQDHTTQLANPVYEDTQTVRVNLPASLTHVAETYRITVKNPEPGGGTSNAVEVEVVTPPDKAPILTAVSPSQVLQHSAPVLQLVGSNFESDAAVFWGEFELANPTFIDSQHMTVAVPSVLTQHVGQYPVTVYNRSADAPSNARMVEVYAPGKVVPVINAVSPDQLGQNRQTVMRLTGTGFDSQAVVMWNGEQPLVTTFVSETELTAVVPASLTGTLGTALITVRNPGLSGTSNMVEIAVVPNRIFLPITVYK